MGSNNPGRPSEISGGGDSALSGANPRLAEFVNQELNVPGALNCRWYTTKCMYPLPDIILGGNSVVDCVSEEEGTDGYLITHEWRNRAFHTASHPDGSSSMTQLGNGTESFRRWWDYSGREITRRGDDIHINFDQNPNDGEIDVPYEISAETGLVQRQYDRWRVVQQTIDRPNEDAAALDDDVLSVSASGQGINREASLDFRDAGTALTYHATSEGIEIVTTTPGCRFFFSGGKLYSLHEDESAGTFTGHDGVRYRAEEIASLGNLPARLGINMQERSVTIDGLIVTVDDSGMVSARSTQEDQLSITLTVDGSQIVRSDDGYETLIGPDGQMRVRGPDGTIVAFFNPYLGIVGNEDVRFGADFSAMGGLIVDLMFAEKNHVVQARIILERQQANTAATAALQAKNANVAFVEGRILEGTVRADCFGPLHSSIGDLNAALSACLASGARDNISLITAALGEVQSQLSMAQSRYKMLMVAQAHGETNPDRLAMLQRYTNADTDQMALLNTFTSPIAR